MKKAAPILVCLLFFLAGCEDEQRDEKNSQVLFVNNTESPVRVVYPDFWVGWALTTDDVVIGPSGQRDVTILFTDGVANLTILRVGDSVDYSMPIEQSTVVIREELSAQDKE